MEGNLDIDAKVREMLMKKQTFCHQHKPCLKMEAVTKNGNDNKTDSTLTLTSQILTSQEGRYILGLECNNISKKQYKSKPYHGGRCTYRYRKCHIEKGCHNNVKINTMNLTISSSDGGCLNYNHPNFALNKLIEFEETIEHASHKNDEVSFQKNRLKNRSSILKNKISDESKTEREEEEDEVKIGKEIDIVIISGGLHYLHLYPIRKYLNNFGLILGHYEQEMNDAILKLRQYLGKGKLVIWKTVNDICDDLYVGDYKQVLQNYSNAGVFD